jgi:hypothetical protein
VVTGTFIIVGAGRLLREDAIHARSEACRLEQGQANRAAFEKCVVRQIAGRVAWPLVATQDVFAAPILILKTKQLAELAHFRLVALGWPLALEFHEQLQHLRPDPRQKLSIDRLPGAGHLQPGRPARTAGRNYGHIDAELLQAGHDEGARLQLARDRGVRTQAATVAGEQQPIPGNQGSELLGSV